MKGFGIFLLALVYTAGLYMDVWFQWHRGEVFGLCNFIYASIQRFKVHGFWGFFFSFLLRTSTPSWIPPFLVRHLSVAINKWEANIYLVFSCPYPHVCLYYSGIAIDISDGTQCLASEFRHPTKVRHLHFMAILKSFFYELWAYKYTLLLKAAILFI